MFIDDLVFLSFVTVILSGYPNLDFPCSVLYHQSVVPHTKYFISAHTTVLKKKIIKITVLFWHLSSKVLIIFNTIFIRLFLSYSFLSLFLILSAVCEIYGRTFISSLSLLKTPLSNSFCTVTSDVSRPFGSPVYWFGCPNSGAQKRFFNFLFEDFF